MNETDEALLLKSQQQDRTAFEELVRRTARLVFSRIFLDTGDTHRAEDLTQETFLVAWRSIAQVTDTKGFRPWLLSIARTTTVDANRRDSRKKRTAPGSRTSADQASAADPKPGPPETLESSEEQQRALNALRALPEEYREPLMLRYLGGADYGTISRQLGLSNGSLRGLLNRGMTRLREMMK